MRIVFAESCTGGLIAATLAQIPGISDHFCGSAVVYRNATKNQWLGVTSRSLEKWGAVSREVSIQMAKGVLKKTREAQISASITGFLGPSGPKKELGHAFISIAIRGSKQVITQELWLMHRKGLTHNIRTKRQLLASHAVLNMVRSLLKSGSQQKRTLKSG
ncbi:MAG: nicotinamide-nucleotide amidohydrolase family protein [Methylotenera sp.]|nr:nicotinamide-nucleotide amidohydrolase family protein [Oligoflexia bacterium]